MAEKEYADNAAKYPGEIARVRKSKAYIGKEDDSVSGRAALEEYTNKAREDDVKRLDPNFIPVSKSGAEAAQAKQREVMNERRRETKDTVPEERLKKGGSVKSSASKRADGIAQRGHTKGKYC